VDGLVFMYFAGGVRLIFGLAGRAFFFLMSKRNKNCRLKIFVLKLVVGLGLCMPKNLLGRIRLERRLGVKAYLGGWFSFMHFAWGNIKQKLLSLPSKPYCSGIFLNLQHL